MGRPRIRVKVEGLEELESKFRRMGHQADVYMTDLMEEATKRGQKASVLAVDGGTGKAVQSIGRNVRIDRRGSQVYSAMARETVKSIDQGRRKTTEWKPLMRPLGRWAHAVGYAGSIAKLAQQVARSGTKGKKFLMAGRRAVEESMPELSREFAFKVQVWWLRR